MHQDIRLFIKDKEVEFSEPFHILFNYKVEDVTSPTSIKNNYTKTLKIEGTEANNRIFANLWDVRKIADGTVYDFDLNRKNDFKLFKNGELQESGYVKLNDIVNTGCKTEYNVTLFGGLGDFFFNLAEREDGTKKTLADLDYWTGGKDEFNFRVTAEKVWEAWWALGTDAGIDRLPKYPWAHIQFAPCLNGVPEDWDTSKMMCEYYNNPFIMQPQPSGPSGEYGYFLSEINGGQGEYDEWQTGDFRAYMQRPLLRVKSMINAMGKPENNGGYSLDLDPAFFNKNNPYWNDSWITLPLIPETSPGREETKEEGITVPTRYMNTFLIKIPLELKQPIIPGKQGNLDLVFNMEILAPYVADNMLASCSQSQDKYYDAWYCVQLVCKDANGNYKYGSEIAAVTSKNTQAYPTGMGLDPVVPAHFKYYKGDFNYSHFNYGYEWYYKFDRNIEISLSNIPLEAGMSFEIHVKKVFETSLTPDQYTGYTTYLPWPKKKNPILDNRTDAYPIVHGESFTFTQTSGDPDMFSKERMLKTKNTPLDYLLSYTKMFGLYFQKDPVQKKISILSRNSYYGTDEVYDLSKRIDLSKEMKITPLAFDKKWYEFKQTSVESKYMEKYKKSNDIDYGIQRVNTNYPYDQKSKNLLEKNIYKNAIMVRPKSVYNANLKAWWMTDERPLPPFCMDGLHTYYFTPEFGQEDGGSDFKATKADNSTPLYKEKYYAPVPLMCFYDEDRKPMDGSNVLCLFNGMQGHKDVNGKEYFMYLTDDIPEVDRLNEKKCWILARSKAHSIDKFPVFGRYRTENNTVTHSFNMANPVDTFTLDYAFSNNSSIYSRYWQSFIQDQYDKSTRILECWVRLDPGMVHQSLRRLFFFEDSYWALLEIKDFDLTEDKPCKCKFIKVMNPENYKSGQSI